MSRTVLVNCRPDQRRVALIEGGLTTELFFERTADRSIAGNIYLGRVVRVLPGMSAAFVEAGLSRTGFLSAFDAAPEPREGEEHRTERPAIKDHCTQGDKVLVQVTKEPIGDKGARFTTHLGLPGRHLVFRPLGAGVGVSRRIQDPDERERLRQLGLRLRPPIGGLIMRTVAEGTREEELRRDRDFLVALWADIERRARVAEPPELVHEVLDVTLRSVRDLLRGPGDRVVVDDEAEAGRIRDFLERFAPEHAGAVEVWGGPDPMFERFGLEWEISRAVRRKIWLRSGGFIAIDRTEAMTVVDVNTGRHVGKRDLEATVLETNVEAAREVAYQLRFRDIGGLIVIDFIDMTDPEHRGRVRATLVEAMADDKARTHVLPISELGLLEMTRKRVRESIVQSLTEPCFYCDGRGYLRSIDVVADAVVSRLRQMTATGGRGLLRVLAHPQVTDRLVDRYQDVLEALEAAHDVTIEVEASEGTHLERVDIV